MMKKLFLFIMLFSISGGCLAQQATLRGIVSDTASKEQLSHAVVSLLRARDSILLQFSRTGAQGKFSLERLPAGTFILLVTYPGYADYVERVTLQDGVVTQVGKIALIGKAKLLEEVVIKQKMAAVKIKGDTTEFTADSFHVQPNATVEDLLKKIPGMQVDKNGKITMQGEAIQKVLVDGEEFFGDDPTLVTQNLRADMIDKVQVFDKKSDQAAFTGIDDGQKNKTINLKLKDNKKNGYFGKVSAGGGTAGYYENQLMANLFKKKLKFSAYGIMSNTGKTGLNWSDRDRYGESSASNIDFDESSGYYSFTGSNDELDSWDGQYNGQGYPIVKTGGLHFNNKWGDDKNSVNGNYKLLELGVSGSSGSTTQYILPDTLYYNNTKELFNNRILRNRANGSYELQLDSSSSVKITANGGTDHKNSSSHYLSSALAADSAIVNSSDRTVNTTGDTRFLNSNLLWKKKMHKKGRTISVNLSENFEKAVSGGFLFAKNDFYKGNIITQEQVTDQYKKYNTEKLAFDSKITYSEPLSKISAMVVNYGMAVNNNLSDRLSYNKAADGKYSSIDTVFSNEYRFNIFTHKAGIAYNLGGKKIRFNAGNNIGITSFSQHDLRKDTTVDRRFINWFPQASLSYAFNTQKRLSVHYNGNTTQPSIQQIQPIRTNDDPLNIIIGNPTLKPQFANNFNLNFNSFKMLTETSVYGSVNYQFMENAISNRSYVDSAGKRTSQSINLNGNYNYSGYVGYGFKLKKAGLNVNFSSQVRNGKYQSVVNNVRNETNSQFYSFGNQLYKEKDKKYELRLETQVTYTTSTSSVQQSIKTHYWTFQVEPGLDIYLPGKIQLHSDAEINLRQKTSAFDYNTNVVLWNAWFGKKLLKSDALIIKFTANDLLNQNRGINRNVQSNFISQNTYSTIQRFFMLSVTWNFNKAGTPAPANN